MSITTNNTNGTTYVGIPYLMMSEEAYAKSMKAEREQNVFMPKIKDVKFFDELVTVVYWNDGTVTRVKIGKGDKFSEEFGLSMAIAKKYRGSYANFAKSLDKAKRYKNKIKIKKLKNE